MINRKHDPVGWASLQDELDDAHGHLGNLIKDLAEDPDYDENNLRIDLGHIYAHLNRAWYRRNVREDLPESEWDKASSFPGDIETVG